MMHDGMDLMHGMHPLMPAPIIHQHDWQIIKEDFSYKGGDDAYVHTLRFGCICGDVVVVPARYIKDEDE